jgi:FkbM family methyltransferase
MGEEGTPQWRRYAARGMQAMPAPVRRAFWSARRSLARRQRRKLERRGDYSASRPALNGLDEALEARLGSGPGFFVEAGAFDGYTQSNTYYLERARGWRGLLVEAVPMLAREAARERPRSVVRNCGLVSADYGEPDIRLRYGGTMTVVAGVPEAEAWASEAQRNMALDEPDHEFTVPARTLSSLLDEVGAPEVDLLSLDVEGYEAEVLRGLDLERHAPRFIVVEVDMLAEREQVEAVLGDRYAAPEQLSPVDLLFERVDGSRSRA